MSTNEAYYLILVCGSFLVLAFGLAADTIRYRQALKPPARNTNYRDKSGVAQSR